MRHTHTTAGGLADNTREELLARFAPEDSGAAPDLRLSLALSHALRAPPEPPRPNCLDVAETLRLLGADRDTLIAALLIDARLDRLLDDKEIAAQFGATVARLVENVHGLLKFEVATGVGDAPEQAERLRRMLLAMVDDVRAVLIKLAYRVQRLRLLVRTDLPEKVQAAREALDIFAPLANRLGIGQIKWEMEDLFFRILEPAEYKRVAKSLEESRVERETYIHDFVEALRKALAEEGIEGEVSGRPKHIYSIWRKMQRKQLDFDELYDLRAVRVIVDRIGTCYAVLGVVHNRWQHIPREFDDYIANPKDNGYQSLHTAVIGPRGRTVEVQVRTREMNEFAELGVAAHWRYKEGGREDTALNRAINSLRRLLEAKDEDADLLDSFRSELFPDRVFVLTPKGQVMDLPKGATPVDFAYAIHSEVGHRCRGAKVNGRIVPLTYELRSGERIEILTARTGGPSRDWLNPSMGYLRTSRARGKAKSWFRQQNFDRNIAEGRTLLERDRDRLGVTGGPDLDDLQRRFHRASHEDLLAAIGGGEITHAQLANALAPPAPEAPLQPKPSRAGKGSRARGDTVHIQGVGNLLTQMARCCRPVPGDAVVGFITRGRGVSVHRADCANILRMPPEKRGRLIEVSWGEAAATWPVDIHIEAFDRSGLLRDITSVLANDKVNVIAANTHTDRDNLTVKMDLTVEVDSSAQLGTVMDKINALPNVTRVQRRRV